MRKQRTALVQAETSAANGHDAKQVVAAHSDSVEAATVRAVQPEPDVNNSCDRYKRTCMVISALPAAAEHVAHNAPRQVFRLQLCLRAANPAAFVLVPILESNASLCEYSG